MAKDWVTKDADPALIAELERNTPHTKQPINSSSTHGQIGFQFAIWMGAIGIICLIGLLWAMIADHH